MRTVTGKSSPIPSRTRHPSDVSDVHPVDRHNVSPIRPSAWFSWLSIPKLTPVIVIETPPVAGAFGIDTPARIVSLTTGDENENAPPRVAYTAELGVVTSSPADRFPPTPAGEVHTMVECES
eukprot:1631067-Rhodomonas_salina.1